MRHVNTRSLAGPIAAGVLMAAAFCPAQSWGAGLAGAPVADSVASTVAIAKSTVATTTKAVPTVATTTKAVVSITTTAVASTASKAAAVTSSTLKRVAPPLIRLETPPTAATSIGPSLPALTLPPASVPPASPSDVVSRALSPTASVRSAATPTTSGDASGAPPVHTSSSSSVPPSASESSAASAVAPAPASRAAQSGSTAAVNSLAGSNRAGGPEGPGANQTASTRNRKADAGYAGRSEPSRSGGTAPQPQKRLATQPATQLRPPSAAQRRVVEGGGGQLWHATTPPGYSSSASTGSGGPGLAITPASHAASQLLVLITALLAALAIGALSVDAAGAGPRNPRWRARWLTPVRRASKRRTRR